MPKILVADDNSKILKDATAFLKQQGFDVVTVGNGEAAVQKLNEGAPDLVLADIYMPGRNGFEVCQFIKNDERFTHVPVILMQGKFDPLDEKELQRVRADAVLRKPFEPPETLVAAVKSHLQRAPKPAPVPKKEMKKAAAEFAAAVPATGDTQRLTPEELSALTGQAEAEEIAQFSTQPPRIEFKEGDQPLAFSELLDGAKAETETEEAEEESPLSFSANIPEIAPPAAHAAPSELTAEIEEPEPPPSFDIQEEAKKPSPDLPPIKVEFGPPEPMELVREEAAAVPLEIAPAPELATSAHDWVTAMPIPSVTPPPEPAAVPPPTPAPQISFDVSPSSAAAAMPPTEEFFKPPVIEPPPPAAVPFPEVDAAPPSSAPSGLPSTELPGLDWSKAAAHPAPPAMEPEPPPLPSPAPVGVAASSGTAAGEVDSALIDSLVEKFLAKLSPHLTDRIAQEVAKRVAEQIGRSDLKK